MRNAVIVIFMVVILVFSGAAIQAAENRAIRKNELESSLSEAMEQSMKILTVHPVYHIDDSAKTDEFAADFIQGFLMKITSNSDFTIEILGMDVEKGLLDVRVTERYKQIIGHGEISCRKTVILEDFEEEKRTFYQVSFWVPEEGGKGGSEYEYVIKQVNVHSGGNLNAAMLPQNNMEREDRTFCGWRMIKPVNGLGILYGEENISTLRVRESLEFKAVYRQEEEL